ncbi:MAG: hypothetical protein AAFP97_09470 [Pseudomonadota bacterium]
MENKNSTQFQTGRSVYIFRSHEPENHAPQSEKDLLRALAYIGHYQNGNSLDS